MGRAAAQIALATSLLLALVSSAPAWSQDATGKASQDAGGAAYEGTQEAGGPVRLVVTGEPARIVLFEVEGVAGGGCSWDTITLANWGGEIDFADGRFEATNPDGDVLTGAWIGDSPPDRRIEGTIQVNDPA